MSHSQYSVADGFTAASMSTTSLQSAILVGVQVGIASLNLLKGEEHLRLKKTLGDAFSEEVAEALRPTLQECTQLFCKRYISI